MTPKNMLLDFRSRDTSQNLAVKSYSFPLFFLQEALTMSSFLFITHVMSGTADTDSLLLSQNSTIEMSPWGSRKHSALRWDFNPLTYILFECSYLSGYINPPFPLLPSCVTGNQVGLHIKSAPSPHQRFLQGQLAQPDV